MFHWDHFGIWWQNMFETNVFFHFPSNEMFPLIPWQIIFDRNNLFSLSQQEFVSTNLKTSSYKFTFCQFYSGDNKLEYKLQFCVVSHTRHKSWRKYDLNKSLTFCSIFLKSQILLQNVLKIQKYFSLFSSWESFYQDKEHPLPSLSNFKAHFTADKLNHHHFQFLFQIKFNFKSKFTAEQ